MRTGLAFSGGSASASLPSRRFVTSVMEESPVVAGAAFVMTGGAVDSTVAAGVLLPAVPVSSAPPLDGAGVDAGTDVGAGVGIGVGVGVGAGPGTGLPTLICASPGTTKFTS